MDSQTQYAVYVKWFVCYCLQIAAAVRSEKVNRRPQSHNLNQDSDYIIEEEDWDWVQEDLDLDFNSDSGSIDGDDNGNSAGHAINGEREESEKEID